MKGKISIRKNETLKKIKLLDNLLYVVIQKENYSRTYQIKNEYERELIY